MKKTQLLVVKGLLAMALLAMGGLQPGLRPRGLQVWVD